MPNVRSEGFQAQDIFRITLGRTLLLRKSLKHEGLNALDVVGVGEMVQQPDDRLFIGESVIFCSAQDVPFVERLCNQVVDW